MGQPGRDGDPGGVALWLGEKRLSSTNVPVEATPFSNVRNEIDPRFVDSSEYLLGLG
jgi:hypothetical protein